MKQYNNFFDFVFKFTGKAQKLEIEKKTYQVLMEL